MVPRPDFTFQPITRSSLLCMVVKVEVLSEESENVDIMTEDIVSTKVAASTSTPETFAITIWTKESVLLKIAWIDTQKCASSGQKNKLDANEGFRVTLSILVLHSRIKKSKGSEILREQKCDCVGCKSRWDESRFIIQYDISIQIVNFCLNDNNWVKNKSWTMSDDKGSLRYDD